MFKTQLYRALVALFVLAALVGCASGGAGGGAAAGPSDEELVTALLDKVTASLEAGDIDAMMADYADDFVDTQGQDKAAMTAFLSGAKEQGFLEGMEIDSSGRTIVVEGDTAKVEGVSLSGAFGVLTLGFELAKRDGEWVITQQSQE
jgi:hypothetical protein